MSACTSGIAARAFPSANMTAYAPCNSAESEECGTTSFWHNLRHIVSSYVWGDLS